MKFKRNDDNTRSILLLINELNLNKNLHWITYIEFIEYQKKDIKRNNFQENNFSEDK